MLEPGEVRAALAERAAPGPGWTFLAVHRIPVQVTTVVLELGFHIFFH